MPADGERVRFPQLSCRAYEHPADRSARVALRRLGGFDLALRRLSGLLRERRHRLLYLAASVRVDSRQFPGVDRIRREAVDTLDLSADPLVSVLRDLGGGVAGGVAGARDRVAAWVRQRPEP